MHSTPERLIRDADKRCVGQLAQACKGFDSVMRLK